MSRERKIQIVTIAVLLLALAGGALRKVRWSWLRPASLGVPAAQSKAGQDPQDAIYAMLAAARAGDVQAYLSNFTGDLRASLAQTQAESGQNGFANYLVQSNAAIKGVAVSDPEMIGEREAKVRVEYVYQDRNEVQLAYLEKSGAVWKIARTDGMARGQTLIPYGTPVSRINK